MSRGPLVSAKVVWNIVDPVFELKPWSWGAGAALSVLLLAAVGAPGCLHGGEGGAEQVEEVELAPYMSRLQLYSQKLGYALLARNPELSGFYLDELEEVLAEVEEIEVHDGLPIAAPARTIMGPLLTDLHLSVDEGAWEGAGKAYDALIDGCNRCHTATEHAFIRIGPASGDPPFNQIF